MKPTRCLILIPAIVSLAAGTGEPDPGSPIRSRTRSFAIDGRQFTVKNPADQGRHPIGDELAKRGVDTGSLPADIASACAVRSAEQLDERPAARAVPALPSGLEPEHVLRLETEAGPVDVAFGRAVCGIGVLFRRLRASGWTCRTQEPSPACATAEFTNGKESCLVLLDETEKRFLAVRRTVR